MKHRITHSRAILAFSVLSLFLPLAGIAQTSSFTLYGPDAESFPTVRAFYLAQKQASPNVDPEQMSGITEKNFTLKDNGVTILPTLITHKCSTITDGPALSVVLVIDKSGSMGEYVNKLPDTTTRFDVVKRAAKSFVAAVKFVPPTAVSIVSFDAISYLEQDFTNNPGLLYKAIDSIQLGGDTRYNNPMLDSTKGGIPMLSRRPPLPVKRVIIFLTDGENNKLYPVYKDSILTGLRNTNVTFFAITAYTEMNTMLAEFAKATGGGAYSVTAGDVEGQLKAIYKQIASRLQSREACYIEWTAPPGCTDLSRERKIEVTFTPPAGSPPPSTFKETQFYLAPERSVVRFTMNPPVLTFGDPAVGQPVTQNLTITSTHDVTLTAPPNITFSGGDFKILSPPFPLNMKAGVPQIVTVQFTQMGQKAFRQGTMVFAGGQPCNPPTVSLRGGYTSVLLTTPVQGTVYSSCDDMVITWTGVPATQKVVLQYSADNGKTWNFITETDGNKYVWPNSEIQKLAQGSTYKIRASLPSSKSYVWLKGAGGSVNDSSTCVAVSQNGLDVFICGAGQGSVDFGGKSINTRNSSVDGYVARYDGAGNIIWASSFGATGNQDVALGVAAGENGESFITGYFVGDALFDGTQKSQASVKTYRNFFMAKMSSSGTFSSVIDLGPRTNLDGEAYGERIAYDPVEKRVYTIGKFRGKLARPNGNALDSGDPTKWVEFTGVFTESGVLIDVQIGTPFLNKPYTTKTATDNEGCIYETGTFSGSITKGTNTIISRGGNDAFLTKFCGIPASSDSTPQAFTIAKAHLTSDEQIGGRYTVQEASIGQSKSTVIPFKLYNSGGIPTEITDVVFSDPAQFDLVSNLKGRRFDAAPKSEKADVEILFTPKFEGEQCSQVTFIASCSPSVTITVCGNGVEPCIYDLADKLDCGRQLITTSKKTSFTQVITNRSNVVRQGKLSVTGRDASEFLISSPLSPNFTLTPGQSLTVEINFTPKESGARTAYLNYGLLSPCENRPTELAGEGFESLNIEVADSNWSCVRVNSSDVKDIAVNNIGAMDATVTAITLQTGTHFRVVGPAPPFTIAAGQSRTVQVAFEPKAEGIQSDLLNVTATGTTTLTKYGTLSGEGCLPHIVLDKNCFPLTRMDSIATKSDALVIQNKGKMTLNVTAINILSSASDFFAPNPSNPSIPIGGTQNIEFKFKPTTSGLITSRIEIVSNAMPGRDTIDVCGEGFAPDTTINYGTIYTCETPFTTITYDNTGSTNTVIDVSMTGANPGEFSISPSGQVTIPRASQRTFTISFKPTTTGTFNAVAKLGPRDVLLQGKAITADLHIATNPAKLTTAIPGTVVPLNVQSTLTEELGTMSLDTIVCTFTVNPDLFAHRSTTPVVNGWVWGASVSADRTTITVTGTPNGAGTIPKGANITLFKLGLDFYLGSVDSSSIPMTVTIKPDRSQCLNITSAGSDDIRIGDICFRNGRLLKPGKTAYSLSTAVPSPASDNVTIRYGVGLDSRATVVLYNSLGSVVETLIDKHHEGGDYEMTLDVSSLPAGVYYYTLTTGQYKEQRQMVITR